MSIEHSSERKQPEDILNRYPRLNNALSLAVSALIPYSAVKLGYRFSLKSI